MIGKSLAHYQILDKIGAGGMGEVYRALDTKLDRDVAIKVLPPGLDRDPERLARFQREARTLASLQHQNVASIYGLETVADQALLVMELVEGEDLSQRLARKTFTLDRVLEIAGQMAAGLEAAHERGIVHRDLKPANIKITPDGDVKILDFGLARVYHSEEETPAADADAPTIAPPTTRAGTILGTTPYMSPEQARGEILDKRSDVWAFGCVLFEMLTGKRCFEGESVTDVLAGIVTREPDWNLLPADLPARGRELLQQTLEKDSRQRLRDMGDIGLMIERTRKDIGRPSPAANTGRPTSRSWIWIVLGLILGAVVGGAITRPWSDRAGPVNLLSGATFKRITDFAGAETDATISRDGKSVAFLSDRDGQADVWAIQIGTGQPFNLTKGNAGEIQSQLRSIGFTYDGSEVWLGGPKARLRRVPLTGGPIRNWLEPEAFLASWSPDGNRIVYRTIEPGDPMYVADHKGANRREILSTRPGNHQHFPIWGNDGWIYLTRGLDATAEMHLWRVRPDGSDGEQLTTDVRNPAYPTPIDSKTLLFTAQEQDGAGPWLWILDLETGIHRRLSFGLEQYTSLSASADGRRLVASVATPQASLWQLPIGEGLATENDVEPFDLPTARALAPRFGPEDLFYLSSRGSEDGLWRYRDGKVLEVWKGTEVPLMEPAAVSADGSAVALILRQNGRQVLHVLSSDGAQVRALSNAVDIRGSVSWSPDGTWIVAGGLDAEGQAGLFKFSVDEDIVEKIVEDQAYNPVWSPDGDLIVYRGTQVNATAPLMGIRPDGTKVELPRIELLTRGERLRFLPNGKGLVYMQGMVLYQDFWLLDLETMESRQLTRLDDHRLMRTFDITPDGTRIVFDRLRDNSDIVLIDLADR
ncbi:MAG: protein kinase [Candidatus Krumholzibacteriota bacterium]